MKPSKAAIAESLHQLERLGYAHPRRLSKRSVGPELASLTDEVPNDADWLHEVKYDGYRILSLVRSGAVSLRSRNVQNWTHRFPVIARSLQKLPVESCVLDGEIVAPSEEGISRFSVLQRSLGDKIPDRYFYYVFDLLYLDGFDLRDCPLLARKKLLESILGKSQSGKIRFARHIRGHGVSVFRRACHSHLEGLISKRVDAPYRHGRSSDWLKSKCHHEEELVIGGYTEPSGAREGFGALLLGYYSGDRLVYAGRVGTGFDEKRLKEIGARLKRDESPISYFSGELSGRERLRVHYVKPRYVAQIGYAEWTADQRLRHPVFLGLREDKKPREVNRAA